MTVLTALILLYWLIRTADLFIGTMSGVSRLAPPSSPEDNTPPKVSVIFAARNEAEHVAEAARSMLAQDYPNFEVVAVNDRSEDGTLEALQSVRDGRLRIIDVRTLPEGWLGKTHALFMGAQAARGEWLLFTDADVIFEPGALRAAWAAVERQQLDHLALFPKVVLKSFIETLFVSYFSLAFTLRFRVWAARNPRSRAYVGIGAFNLVRRRLYESMGGHRALALDIADDMMLGKKLKSAGARQAGLFGGDWISVRWVRGWRGVLGALHKNGFRGLDYNWAMLAGASVGMVLVDVIPFAGLWLLTGASRAMCAGAVACIGLCYLAAGIYSGARTLASFGAHAAGSLLFNFILWRSALSTLRQGGISWRGTLYRMSDLRNHSENL